MVGCQLPPPPGVGVLVTGQGGQLPWLGADAHLHRGDGRGPGPGHAAYGGLARQFLAVGGIGDQRPDALQRDWLAGVR